MVAAFYSTYHKNKAFFCLPHGTTKALAPEIHTLETLVFLASYFFVLKIRISLRPLRQMVFVAYLAFVGIEPVQIQAFRFHVGGGQGVLAFGVLRFPCR